MTEGDLHPTAHGGPENPGSGGDDRLDHAERLVNLLRGFNRAVHYADDESELLEQLCRLMVDTGGYTLAWVGCPLSDPHGTVTPMISAGEEDGYLRAHVHRRSPDADAGLGLVGQALRSGRPVFADDPGNPDGYEAPGADHACGPAVAALPLPVSACDPLVLVLHHQPAWTRWPGIEREILTELTESAGRDLAGRRSQNRERRLHDAVATVAHALSARDADDFLARLTRRMATVLGADAGFVARTDPDDPEVAHTVGGIVDGREVAGFRYTLDGTPCATSIAEDWCVVPENVTQIYPADEMLTELGAEAYVGLRLDTVDHRMIGLLIVLYRQPVADPELVLSVLRVFAAATGAELERQSHERQIQHQAALLASTYDALFITDGDGRITYWNRGAEQLYGWSTDEAVGASARKLLHTVDRHFDEAMNAVLATGRWQGEMVHATRSGDLRTLAMHWTASPAEDDGGQAILHVASDITEARAARERVEQLAFYDDLTGLPNRALFVDRLEQAMARAGRQNAELTLLFLDLNRFKEINDSQGHSTGDQALLAVSHRLSGVLRRGETLARFGGDEFVLLAEGGQAAAGPALADRLNTALSEPLEIEGQSFGVDSSIGIVGFPQDGVSTDELLKHADLAMYDAKRRQVPYAQYVPRLSTDLDQQVDLYRRFVRALRDGALEVYYQPQVALDTGQLIGAEALLRWYDDELGWVSPARFIPMAEERHLMGEVGRLVLRAVCAQIQAWRGDPGLQTPPKVAVNIAAQHFESPGFLHEVDAVLDAHGLHPSCIALELTETGVMADPAQGVVTTQALRDRGIAVAVDDFGTGYSSLSYLKELTIDTLKVDVSFVRDMLTDDSDATIVSTILSMARNLDMDSLAEGVETGEHAARLIKNGCYRGQGFFYDQPRCHAGFARRWLAPAAGMDGGGHGPAPHG